MHNSLIERATHYSGDDLLYPFFVALHFQECFDLADGEIFPVPESNDLVKGAQQFVGILQDFSFVQTTLADTVDNLNEEVQGVDIL